MADPRRLREILGFGYGAPSPAMSALEPFHAGVDPAYMPQDVVTASPGEGPSPYVRRGIENVLGTVIPDRWASQWADKLNAVADFNPLQGAYDIGKAAGDAVQGGDGLDIAMSMIPGKVADDLVPAVKAAQKALKAPSVPAAPRSAAETLWHPVSTIKLQKPLEEMRQSMQQNAPMLDKKLILPEDFKIGDRLLMFPGDRTAAGKQLTGIGDLEFKTPVNLFGGGEYQRGPHQIANKTAWASHGGVMKGHAKRAREGSAKGGDVHGGYVPMAHPASDFSQQTTNAVKQTIQAKLDRGEITQAQVDAFDERVRGTRGKEGSTDFIGPSPDWPGILNATQEQIESHGPTRLKVAKFADSKEYGHLVDMGELRKAINSDDLLDTAPYDFGFSFAKMDPEGRFAENPTLRHPDYNTQGLGEYEGGWDFNAPLDVTMRDWAKATAERKGMPLSAMNPARLQRSAYMQNPTQTIDQEWIDTLMMLRQQQLGGR